MTSNFFLKYKIYAAAKQIHKQISIDMFTIYKSIYIYTYL